MRYGWRGGGCDTRGGPWDGGTDEVEPGIKRVGGCYI